MITPWKNWVRALSLLLLVFWSGEIMVRRWAWDQVPSQVSAGLVCLLLLQNLLLVGHGLKSIRLLAPWATTTKIRKS